MIQTSLNNVVAIIHVLRILFLVWTIPPVFFILLPIATHSLFFIIDILANGYGIILVLGTIAFTVCGRGIINAYAPSAKQCEDALRKSSISLPILSLIGFRVVLGVLLIPFTVSLGMDEMLKVQLQMPYVTIFIIAAAMMKIVTYGIWSCTLSISSIPRLTVNGISKTPRTTRNPIRDKIGREIELLRNASSHCFALGAYAFMIPLPHTVKAIVPKTKIIP
mmetsp:Transcript_27305/g.41300  ORF Transcript_27305/g.41300 Transcript_27305/m.41300 type:complete len:221 (-) Transcript_27305:325-987(-)